MVQFVQFFGMITPVCSLIFIFSKISTYTWFQEIIYLKKQIRKIPTKPNGSRSLPDPHGTLETSAPKPPGRRTAALGISFSIPTLEAKMPFSKASLSSFLNLASTAVDSVSCVFHDILMICLGTYLLKICEI